MTWREKVVVALLLLVARMIADDTSLRAEIKSLATHISVHAPQPGEPA